MRLATVRVGNATRAAVLDDDEYVVQDAPDVGALLRTGGISSVRPSTPGAQRVPVETAALDHLVSEPEKVICVGLNYRSHAAETGLDIPAHPALFAKYRRALLPPNGEIQIPSSSGQPDWEAELVLVIGATVRNVSPAEARVAIAGVTVANDISMRDWQRRTTQWLQGKTFEATTPVGPCLATYDEFDDPDDLHLWCEVNGDRVQDARTEDMVFSPSEIVAYISQIVTLVPGDLILTGTPSGIGARRTPPLFLQPGDTVRTGIDGIGVLDNRCVARS